MQKFVRFLLLSTVIFSIEARATPHCEVYFDRLLTWARMASQKIEIRTAETCLELVEGLTNKCPLLPKSCEKVSFSKMSDSFQIKWSKLRNSNSDLTLKEVAQQFQAQRFSNLNRTCREKKGGAIVLFPKGKIHQSASPDPL